MVYSYITSLQEGLLTANKQKGYIQEGNVAESQRRKKIMTNAYKIRALWYWGVDEGALLGRTFGGPQRLAQSPHTKSTLYCMYVCPKKCVLK